MLSKVFCLMGCMLLVPSLGHGHGVTYRIVPDRTVAVRFGYSDGEAMSFAEFKIFGPRTGPNSSIEYQNGRSDMRGMVSFVPSGPGNWTVHASDGMGHKGSFIVEVSDDMIQPTSGAADTLAGSSVSSEPWLRAVLGVSLLLNLGLLGRGLRRMFRPSS